MSFYADLHVHSRYSRATSKDCDLEHLAWWAARKGIAVVGTGDFTHPAWLGELQDTLVPAESGLFRLRPDLERQVASRLPTSCRTPVRFLLSVEISTIYKRGERTRKVHHLVYAPDFETVATFNRHLSRIGNLGSDGRPILGLDSRDLLEITLSSGEGAYLVPAHVWTPWFAVLGSMSGFDAIEDCYADLADHIFAIETGLSSDPAMNWRVSGLDRYRLVSNSDAHSPPALGREATVFATDIEYHAIRRALETGEGFGGTVEFFPEEGKYHLDGHRKCGLRLEPAETRQLQGKCPVCAKPVTVGVMHRVEALADRDDGYRPEGGSGFHSLVPLHEVIGEILGVGSRSKRVEQEVSGLVTRLGPELDILQRLSLDTVQAASSTLMAEAIGRLRRGQVTREAGYDGEYGVIRLFSPEELRRATAVPLFDAGPVAAVTPTSTSSPLPRLADDPVPIDEHEPQPQPPPSANHATSSAVAGEEFPLPTEGSSLLSGLDPEQRAVATAPGPLLVIAGPGTGKTRALTHRLAHLVSTLGVVPERCCAITFTRRACEELRQRLSALVPEMAERIMVTTFHGLGWQIIRDQHLVLGLDPDVRVADEAERLALLGDLFKVDTQASSARRLLNELSGRKRAGEGESDARLERYNQALHSRNLVDFDDLAVLPAQLLARDSERAATYRQRWPHLAIDEYQDVDEWQYRLLGHLAPPDGDLCAIGDPDQAIYGFRGGDVGFFLRFTQDFPTARSISLARNYRSSPVIVAGALQAIEPDSLVPGRTLQTMGPRAATGAARRIVVLEAVSERAEAELVVRTVEQLIGGSSHLSIDSGRADGLGVLGGPGAGDGGALALGLADFAVLARTDGQLGVMSEAFDRAGLPVQRRSHDRLVHRPGVEALVERVREMASADEVAAARRPLSVLLAQAAAAMAEEAEAVEAGSSSASAAREIDTAVELLGPLTERCGCDLDRFCAELALGAEVDTWDPRAQRVSLLTLHAAKGLEFPIVFLVGCEEGLLPLSWDSAKDLDVAEERRLFFVGMTRARSRLYLSVARKRLRHGAVVETTPSRFLAAVDPDLLQRLTIEPPSRSRPSPKPPSGEQLQLL